MEWISKILSRWKKKPDVIEHKRATKICDRCRANIEIEARYCPCCKYDQLTPLLPSGMPCPYTGMRPEGYYFKGYLVTSGTIETTLDGTQYHIMGMPVTSGNVTWDMLCDERLAVDTRPYITIGNTRHYIIADISKVIEPRVNTGVTEALSTERLDNEENSSHDN